MTVYLVRHGETPLNAARVFQFPDTPLSERGAGQARKVAGRLAESGIERVLSSDYLRARMTAEAIARAAGAEVEIDPVLRERSFGDHRGKRHDDIGVDVFAAEYEPPNGESVGVFSARVALAWAAIEAAARRTNGALAVVSHGHVCRAIVASHLEVEDGARSVPARWENTSVTVIDGGPPWSASLVACAVHLEEPTGVDGR